MKGNQSKIHLYHRTSQEPVTQRLLVISRYVENLRRLSRLADRTGRGELGTALVEVAGCLDVSFPEVVHSERI
ncbi:hypothetical protein ACC699_31960 [Rhizobium ruizarguesonis]